MNLTAQEIIDLVVAEDVIKRFKKNLDEAMLCCTAPRFAPGILMNNPIDLSDYKYSEKEIDAMKKQIAERTLDELEKKNNDAVEVYKKKISKLLHEYMDNSSVVFDEEGFRQEAGL